jgi:hypothetical protein
VAVRVRPRFSAKWVIASRFCCPAGVAGGGQDGERGGCGGECAEARSRPARPPRAVIAAGAPAAPTGVAGLHEMDVPAHSHFRGRGLLVSARQPLTKRPLPESLTDTPDGGTSQVCTSRLGRPHPCIMPLHRRPDSGRRAIRSERRRHRHRSPWSQHCQKMIGTDTDIGCRLSTGR